MSDLTGDKRGYSGVTPDLRLAELAAQQWGVVSLGQLRALGLGEDAVRRRARAGRLHRVHRGVYAVGHSSLNGKGRWLAAVLACGDGAVLSHRSAAAHWGLLQTDATRIDVTTPRQRVGNSAIRLHFSRSLIARDTTTYQGIPITSVPRTLLDLAATVRADRLEQALAQAQRQQLYDHAAIEDVLARANGHRGTGALTRATAREPSLTRSELEARFLSLVRAARLPEPLTNFYLTAPDHPRLEVDFCWPSYQLVVECDGWETHRTRAAFEADRRRDAALQADGWRVMRFTWRTDDATIVRGLRALLATPARTHPRHGSPVR